jgi:hypothetical protein
LKEKDQEYNISQVQGLGALTVSSMLECEEETGSAIAILERSRGIMENLKLEMRFDISLFKSTHPSLAQEFEDVRYQLDHPAGSGPI